MQGGLLCILWMFVFFLPYSINGQGLILNIDMEDNSMEEMQKIKAYHSFDKDSLTAGIHGKARYFSQTGESNTYSVVNDTGLFNPLWKDGDFTIELWVQTTAANDKYPVIATNKDWSSGEIKDFTTNHEFGFSRMTGNNKGWAILCQPDGSWAWNIGDGENRLDYRPTAPRQQINDGQWHQISFAINRTRKEARLYFDGLNVAIYNIGGIKNLDSEFPLFLGADAITSNNFPGFEGAIDEFKVYDRVLSTAEIWENYHQYVPAAKLPELPRRRIEKLNLMAWNIWHGGRRHGREIGPRQVIDFIKDTQTDIVMMQETYGSGPLIADALGYYFYLASTNISVLSKYPILETWTIFDPFRCGMTTIQLAEGQKINLGSLWIHYLPAWRRDSHHPDATPQKLIIGEGTTRHKEIKEILGAIEPLINDADQVPLIIGGDFNSPSFKDWTPEVADWHNDLAVEWPVSKEMINAGFTDSFREIRPDLHYAAPTMTAEKLTYRIDYIYYKGKNLKALDSNMHFQYKGAWPSDHPAVTTTLSLK